MKLPITNSRLIADNRIFKFSDRSDERQTSDLKLCSQLRVNRYCVSRPLYCAEARQFLSTCPECEGKKAISNVKIVNASFSIDDLFIPPKKSGIGLWATPQETVATPSSMPCIGQLAAVAKSQDEAQALIHSPDRSPISCAAPATLKHDHWAAPPFRVREPLRYFTRSQWH